VPKPPLQAGTGGGGKPGGLGKYFDKALYFFEHPYTAGQSGVLPPPSGLADLNYLTASATPPTHRRSYNPKVGGYYSFADASSQSFALGTDIADNQDSLFVAALVRPRVGNAADASYLFGGHGSTKCIDWRLDAEVMTSYIQTNAGAEIIDFIFERAHYGEWMLAMFAYKLNTYHKIGINGAWIDSANITNTSFGGTGDVDLFIGHSGNAGEYFTGDIAFLGVGTAIPTAQQIRYIHYAVRNGVELPPPSGDGPPGDDPGDGNSGSTGRILLLGVG
jgi:hypothetical protein